VCPNPVRHPSVARLLWPERSERYDAVAAIAIDDGLEPDLTRPRRDPVAVPKTRQDHERPRLRVAEVGSDASPDADHGGEAAAMGDRGALDAIEPADGLR
jgi:hypothetical protein